MPTTGFRPTEPLGNQLIAQLEGGYRFVVPAAYNAIGITPYAAIQAQNFRTPTYTRPI